MNSLSDYASLIIDNYHKQLGYEKLFGKWVKGNKYYTQLEIKELNKEFDIIIERNEEEYEKKLLEIIEREGYEILTTTNITSGNIYSKYVEIPNAILLHKKGNFLNCWFGGAIDEVGFDDQIDMFEFRCLHCEEELYDFHKSGFSENCPKCNWKNELIESYEEKPIAMIIDYPENTSTQICYPEITEKNLEEIPKKLQTAIKLYFYDNGSRFRLSREQYQNIKNNLIQKNAKDFDKISTKYRNKSILAKFFQRNF